MEEENISIFLQVSYIKSEVALYYFNVDVIH